MKPFEAFQSECVSKTNEVEMEVQCMCLTFDSSRHWTPESDQTPDRLICGLAINAELAVVDFAEVERDDDLGVAGFVLAAPFR